MPFHTSSLSLIAAIRNRFLPDTANMLINFEDLVIMGWRLKRKLPARKNPLRQQRKRSNNILFFLNFFFFWLEV
jgi:hypothetical protein